MQVAQADRSCAEDGLRVMEADPAPPQIRPLSPITKGKEGGQEGKRTGRPRKVKLEKINLSFPIVLAHLPSEIFLLSSLIDRWEVG